jgi:hypothetical protein
MPSTSWTVVNDLEGICAIPNRPGEYLIVDGGFYLGHFGRAIKIGFEEGAPLSVTYLGSFQPSACSSTPKPKQIEGIAVVTHEGGMTVLLLALRGGKEKPDEPGTMWYPRQLIWGTLTDIDTPNLKFTQSGTPTLSYKPSADRGAVDLYVLSKRQIAGTFIASPTLIREIWDFDPLCTWPEH